MTEKKSMLLYGLHKTTHLYTSNPLLNFNGHSFVYLTTILIIIKELGTKWTCHMEILAK